MNDIHFLIRAILPSDKTPLQEGLKMLSPESIRQRFFLNKKEFSADELKFLTEVDQHNHLALMAFHQQGEVFIPAGVIRAIKSSTLTTHAEVGIVIVDQYHGHGLGIRLMTELAERSLSAGITHFCGDYHTSNAKMIKLLEKFMKNRGALSLKHVADGFIHFEGALR